VNQYRGVSIVLICCWGLLAFCICIVFCTSPSSLFRCFTLRSRNVRSNFFCRCFLYFRPFCNKIRNAAILCKVGDPLFLGSEIEESSGAFRTSVRSEVFFVFFFLVLVSQL